MMTTERHEQSVIAKLMGFQSVPLKQQLVYRRKRVLSEDYLQKSASLGLRERRSSKIRQTNPEVSQKSNSTLIDLSKDKQRSQSTDFRTTFGWEFKKQLLERSKRAKVCREIWSPFTKSPIPKHTSLQILKDSQCEKRFKSLSCIEIDDELQTNATEAYQPSPNSVLEPDNSSISEYDDSLTTDLHTLWTKLQILKSESEKNQSKPEIVTSSDGDVDADADAIGIRLGPKESQEHSYLVSVLDEIESFQSWHFVEHIINTSCFERLEKKYAKQELSWNKADRRLLFDRIKLRLSEILRPYVDFSICSKLLRRKMSTDLRRDAIEEEVWNVLVSEGNEVNADLSEKAVGKEPWLELGEEVDSIVGEIEAFLFNEIVLELVEF